MKILVTGGFGFIGSNFLNIFVNRYPEHDFYNIDSLTYASNFDNLKDIKDNKNYKFIRADISRENQVRKIFDLVCPDCVIHFAAVRSILVFNYYLLRYMRSCTLAVKDNIIEEPFCNNLSVMTTLIVLLCVK